MLDLVPERPGLVLDVGAGSGRDAGWFAVSGWDVVAVDRFVREAVAALSVERG